MEPIKEQSERSELLPRPRDGRARMERALTDFEKELLTSMEALLSTTELNMDDMEPETVAAISVAMSVVNKARGI